MESESIVERVAKAIRENDDACGGERHGQYWNDLARAAISAMRPEVAAVLSDAEKEYPDDWDAYFEVVTQNARGLLFRIDAALK